MLTVEQSKELVARGFSRRNFGRLATMLAAGSTLPFYNEQALAQLSMIKGGIPEGAVKIDANENPMGPCPEALEAIHKAAANGGRYDYQLTFNMTETLAEQEGVKPSYVKAYPGSSAPLHHAVLAFCSPTKPYVMADPGYEQGAGAAKFLGAKTIRVPLMKDYSHDVKAMVAASPDAGLIYICNPNNPTGSITKKSDIEWAVANKPKGSVIMIDEAYFHIAGISPCSDLVAADKDVIILRTFSKIYGMAGIRAGAAIARPDLLEKMGSFMAGALPTTAMGAANASLKSKMLVPERREKIKVIREDTMAFLDKHGYKTVTSVSNKFMVDTKRPATDVIMAMRKEKVYIGRPWPVWPTYVRVTVGTQDDMTKFKAAFLKVMA
jgi:histidinol-phosphate/aromatic aminotransferase/cobyric acid decarboxylase-like protein